MRRVMILAVLGVVCSALVAVRAAQTPARPQTAEIQKVKENLNMISGGGGNTAALGHR